MTFRPFAVMALAIVAAISLDAQTYKVIHNFPSGYENPNSEGSLAQTRGGYIIGSSNTYVQGNPRGVVFRMTTGGQYVVLHQFTTSEGYEPFGGLTVGKDGWFYGTTENGPGSNVHGTVFRMNKYGNVTTLHVMTSADGGYSYTAPIQSVAGDFYGTAISGTIYRMSPSGSFQVIHDFGSAQGNWPPLIQAMDPDFGFYGVTFAGGINDQGTAFRIDSSGNFTTLFQFDSTHGANPPAALVQAADGNFYGVTDNGGANGMGVIFRMTPQGVVTVMHSFGGPDGNYPRASMVAASDGNLYGTTEIGGTTNQGVLFRISPSTGAYTVVHNFSGSSGWAPDCGLMQHTNGLIYATTGRGGPADVGVLYSMDLGLPPFVEYLPVYGRPGATVQIYGQGFTNSTQVLFNGVPAASNTVYPTYLTAVVPPAATTGYITVVTPSGTLKSNKIFVVHPQ